MSNKPKIEVILEHSKDTEHTFQYKEVVVGEFSAPVLRNIYISKAACGHWGSKPRRVKVTLEIIEAPPGEIAS
jgi:hypothetical protein